MYLLRVGMRVSSLLILLLGICTLLVYVVYPPESFTTQTATTTVLNPSDNKPIDIERVLGIYKNMSVDEKEELKEKVAALRRAYGFTEDGYPTAATEEKRDTVENAPMNSQREGVYNIDLKELLRSLSSYSGNKPKDAVKEGSTLTPSEIQGMMRDTIREEMEKQRLVQENRRQRYPELYPANKPSCPRNKPCPKPKPVEPVVRYYPKRCPSPDPAVWVKRDEIPCYACKI